MRYISTRIFFSLRFYCYIFFAVLLDMSMTTIGVSIIGFQAEKNPYVYNHMISGTYWSSFIPELIQYTVLLAISTVFISAIVLYYLIFLSKLEFKSKEGRSLKKCISMIVIMMFAVYCVVPGLFFSQGILWIGVIILQEDYSTWFPKVLLQIAVAVLVLFYVWLGTSMLGTELTKTIDLDQEEDLLCGIPRVFRN